LVHCQTVPVGLFTNVTDNLTSVTVASEDAVQLLGGTFEGLEQVTELRMLGFTMLKNLSRSMLEPLRNIHTLILDGFGSVNIQLPYLGSVIRKLSGTPIRRLVLNRIKRLSFVQEIMRIDNFKICNASVKELIITDAPLNYEGSIRRAFPDIVCFCGGGRFDYQTDTTFPAIFDLIVLSNQLDDVILYRPQDFSIFQSSNRPAVPVKQLVPSIFRTARLYPDLISYFLNRLKEGNDQHCELRFAIKLGDNLTKVTINRIFITITAAKPVCIQEDNNLIYSDWTGSLMPNTIPLFTGLKKLEYLSLKKQASNNCQLHFYNIFLV